MKTTIQKAAERGHADHGWLNTYHSFSFANYFNPEKVHFGALRVFNDDTVSGGMGFGKHPHKNMEIISIPLEGDLRHGDNMGNEGIIRKGDVQVMSAGTGVVHSEYNANTDKPVKFFQIWIFPRTQDVAPRYDQIRVADYEKQNDFQQIVSPYKDEEGAWIHQDAWLYLAKFDKGVTKTYTLKKQENGVYIFVIEGKAKIGDNVLERRDSIGVWETDSITIEALENAEILIIDVPMENFD